MGAAPNQVCGRWLLPGCAPFGGTPDSPLPTCGPMQAELLKGDWVSSLTGLLYVNDPAVLPPAVVSVHRLAASHDPLARCWGAWSLLRPGLHGLLLFGFACRAPISTPMHALSSQFQTQV